jgi:hypothetical protein
MTISDATMMIGGAAIAGAALAGGMGCAIGAVIGLALALYCNRKLRN